MSWKEYDAPSTSCHNKLLTDVFNEAVLHKYSRPVAKCDLWITWATQNAAMDGPLGN